MSRIRGKDTTPEKIVRSLLHRLGYRFRLHVRIPIQWSAAVSKTSRSTDKMKNRLNSSKAVGHITPTNRREWWLAKLNGNAARDQRHQAAVRKLAGV